MCGITGVWDFSRNTPLPLLKTKTKSMTETLSHRGPDGHGVWVDESTHMAFGHRRLSIIDLSNHARQPMTSQSGRFIITYNGEIYNYQALRETLVAQGVSLKTTSDTEVLLEMCAHFGLEKTLEKLIGMFAFALWDTKTKKLFLVRDRLGIKPLYWGLQNDTFAFGSELTPLKHSPHWSLEIDPQSVGSYFLKGYVPAPQSIYKHIFKLEPGHLLSIDAKQNIEKHAYWSIEKSIKETQKSTNIEQLTEEFDALITDAVQQRLVSDVPLGCFLSGGVDSATVAAKMQSLSHNPIKTFSIGFEDKAFNEAPQAKKIAAFLGTDHTETILTTDTCLKITKNIHKVYDEPFGDSSQIPTLLVSKVAREKVTVALSGDGGDEVFGGYNRYRAVQKLWPLLSKTPLPLRKGAKETLAWLAPLLGHNLAKSLLRTEGDLKQVLQKLSSVLATQSIEEFYRTLTTQQSVSKDICLPVNNQKSFDHLEAFENFQYWDFIDYLPNDILTKVDRASMHAGLEARVPLLDHRIVEKSWQLPAHAKIYKGETKWILRRILERHVPASISEGPKRGFAIPLSDWLKGPLKTWAQEILYTKNDFINMQEIERLWESHQSGAQNHAQQIWTFLNFNLWYQDYT